GGTKGRLFPAGGVDGRPTTASRAAAVQVLRASASAGGPPAATRLEYWLMLAALIRAARFRSRTVRLAAAPSASILSATSRSSVSRLAFSDASLPARAESPAAVGARLASLVLICAIPSSWPRSASPTA